MEVITLSCIDRWTCYSIVRSPYIRQSWYMLCARLATSMKKFLRFWPIFKHA